MNDWNDGGNVLKNWITDTHIISADYPNQRRNNFHKKLGFDMEIVKDKVAMLSNYEVLSLLQNIAQKERGKKPVGFRQQLATVTYETTKYLEKQPCHLQNEEIIKQFLQSMAPFKLTKAEKLQLLNHRPTTPVEIQVIVEECEERLDQEQIDSLLDVVASILPGETSSDDGAMDQG